MKEMRDGFIESTLGGWMDYMAETNGDHEALVNVERGLRLTYKELNEISRKTAKAFMAMGVKKGDKVAIWAANYPEWLYTLFGASKIGAVLVTVNTNYKVFEMEYLLNQSDTHTLVFMSGMKGTSYVDIIRELVPAIGQTGSSVNLTSERFPFLKNCVFVPRDKSEEIPSSFTSWDFMMQLADGISDEQLDAMQAHTECHEVINMQYTSGTTGFPKGVMLTHYNILNNGRYVGENMAFTKDDRLLICVPLFHCFGLTLATMASITHGSTMVLVDAFSPEPVMQSIEKERCTAVHGVPTMFIFMLDHPNFDQYDLSSLRTGIMAGSTCPVNVMKRVIEKMHMREITITYGQTECAPAATMSNTTDPFEVRVSSVGRAMPFCETKIVDIETCKDVGPGVQGEFCCRGYNVMKGYYKMAEATATVIDQDGWLHTGDLAIMDENGYYSITGRIKDMIIRGGENIYPREIEEILYLHEKVSDVQVVGVASEKFGEEVMVFIIPKEGQTITADEIKAFVRGKAARYKVPSFVAFVTEFPMTASGKIQKFKLREQAAAILSADNADAGRVTA